MNKKLTQRQAWVHLASLWDSPDHDDLGHFVRIGDFFCEGLCLSINAMYQAGEIDQATALSMMDITKAIPPNQRAFPFKWMNTRRGARQRAAFCRKQATICRR